MIKLNVKLVVIIGFVILISQQLALGQSVRSLNNTGVESFKKEQFVDAEVNFKKGLKKSKDSFELNYNLGDAYYKQQKYDEAIESFQTSLSKTEDNQLKSKALHNIGNSLLKSQKIKESVESYKNALKLNPNDPDTKYNLSYALSLLKQQEQKQQDKNQNDKNQDKQDQKDQNKNDQQDKNKQDEKNQQQQEQKPQNKDQEAKQDNLKQPEKNKISKEEAERILEALKNNEKDLQKKLRKKVGVPVQTDKDW